MSQQEQSITTSSEPSPTAQSKIMVFLLDSSLGFTNVQEELLSLAKRLQGQGFDTYIFCPEASKLMQKASESEILALPISKTEKPSFRGLWRAYWKQKKNIPLFIHSFAENCIPFARRIAARRKENSTLIFHSCFNTPVQTKSLAKYWDVPKKIIYPSKYIATLWTKLGINPDKVAVIHTASQDLPPYGEQKSKRWVFIATESLEHNSGVDFLLKAMSALWQHPYLPEWEMRIVGDGPFFGQLLDEAHSLGVESRIALLGEQDIAEVIQYAQAMICPFIEGQGNISALMRAWNCGVPLICTMVNAHMEIANTNNALLVPEADPQRLAAAMIELMCRPERMEHFVRTSAVMRSYSQMSRLQNQYFKLYQDCITKYSWPMPAESGDKVSTTDKSGIGRALLAR